MKILSIQQPYKPFIIPVEKQGTKVSENIYKNRTQNSPNFYHYPLSFKQSPFTTSLAKQCYENLNAKLNQNSRLMLEEGIEYHKKAKELYTRTQETINTLINNTQNQIEKEDENGREYVEYSDKNIPYAKMFYFDRGEQRIFERIEIPHEDGLTDIINLNLNNEINEIFTNSKNKDEILEIGEAYFFSKGELNMFIKNIKRTPDSRFEAEHIFKYVQGNVFNSTKNFIKNVDESTSCEEEYYYSDDKPKTIYLNHRKNLSGDINIDKTYSFENGKLKKLETDYRENGIGEKSIGKRIIF